MGDETQPTVGESAGYSGALSEFAGPYVSEMLGKGAALADMPYTAYEGPLTAGASALQDQAFTGYGALDTSPTTSLGSFSAMGAPMMGGLGSFQPQPFFEQPQLQPQPQPQPLFEPLQPQPAMRMVDNRFQRDIAGEPVRRVTNTRARLGDSLQQRALQPQQPSVTAQYMNPYLQAVLDPQLREARRQADVSRIADASRLTKAGAFGGSRQAIMESEGRRNLGQLQSDITAKGYSDAFDRARSQFNTEEDRRIAAEQADRRYGLDALSAMGRAGDRQREIEQEGITADYLQFEKERKYPYEQLAFQQSLLSGLPIAARQESYIEPSGYSTTAGGLNDILNMLAKFGIGALA